MGQMTFFRAFRGVFLCAMTVEQARPAITNTGLGNFAKILPRAMPGLGLRKILFVAAGSFHPLLENFMNEGLVRHSIIFRRTLQLYQKA
jgi:hypothetical protein